MIIMKVRQKIGFTSWHFTIAEGIDSETSICKKKQHENNK